MEYEKYMTFTPDDIKSLAPLFFEDEFQKGHEDRVVAIVAVALFIGWLKHRVKEKHLPVNHITE
jgi:hypothetical protein